MIPKSWGMKASPSATLEFKISYNTHNLKNFENSDIDKKIEVNPSYYGRNRIERIIEVEL